MGILNIFKSQTKKPLYSSSQSQYAQPQQKAVSMSAGQSGSAASFGQKVASGQGVRAVQDLFSVKKPVSQPAQPKQSPLASYQPAQQSTQNVSKQPARSPLASYADTPYTPPRTQTAAPAPSAPTQPQSNPNQSFLDSIDSSANRQRQFAEEQRKQKEDYVRAQYGLANSALESSIPQYQNDFNTFKSNTEAGINDLRTGGESQKGQARDYYGEAQRQAAQSRNEVRGQTQRTFANLGTTDSRGEGSFQQATENQDSEFNRFTQQNLKAQADKLSQIDMSVSQAERNARNAITQEEQKMNGLVRQIQLAQSQNKLDEAAQLTDAYNQSQQYIYDIEDSVNNIKYQAQIQQQELQNALDLQMSEVAGLSPEFMQTGVAQNMNDFIYRTKNPSAFGKIGAQQPGAKAQSASSLQVSGKANAGLAALNQIESELRNNPMITALYAIPGSPGARQYSAAVSSLTDAIGGLRTGASVSPQQQKFYERMLPQVGDSPETIQYKINAVRNELQGYAGGAQNMGSEQLNPEQLQQIIASLGA